MPLDNSLNVSELLRRLGVKGDSLGSAPLLESIRLSLLIGDLSDQVPPVAVPIGGVFRNSSSGVGTANQWTLQCQSPGGLTVVLLETVATTAFEVWITDANPFAAPVARTTHNYAFGEVAQSILFGHAAAAKVAPVDVLVIRGPKIIGGSDFPNWVGPGQFFNIEAFDTNIANQHLSILWKEFPAGLNP